MSSPTQFGCDWPWCDCEGADNDECPREPSADSVLASLRECVDELSSYAELDRDQRKVLERARAALDASAQPAKPKSLEQAGKEMLTAATTRISQPAEPPAQAATDDLVARLNTATIHESGRGIRGIELSDIRDSIALLQRQAREISALHECVKAADAMRHDRPRSYVSYDAARAKVVKPA